MTEEEFALAYAGFVELHSFSRNESFFMLASKIEYVAGKGISETVIGPVVGEESYRVQETPREIIAKIAKVKRLMADEERRDRMP